MSFSRFVVAAVVLLLAPLTSQAGGCPNRGVKWVPPEWNSSDPGVRCAGGIGFTHNGITYTAAESRCPSAVEYRPGHTEPDANTFKHCTRWEARGTYKVTKQRYTCVFYFPPLGCGFLGLGQCCEPIGPEVVVGNFPNYIEVPCRPCEEPQAGSVDPNVAPPVAGT